MRSPNLYLRDSGRLHNLLGIETSDDLLAQPHFLRTSNGAELIAPVEQAFEARPGIWVRPPP